MKQRRVRNVLAPVALIGGMTIWAVPLSPQGPVPITPGGQPAATPAQGAPPQAPGQPGQPQGRGGPAGWEGLRRTVGSAPTAAQAGPGPGAQPAPPAFTPPPAAYPRRYKVEVSIDGTTWGAPVAEGEGAGPSTVITFAPTRARFIRITQTATVENAPSWSIQRLRLYEVAGEK